MDATTTPEAHDRPFLTLAEAGATIGRSAAYVQRLLQRLPGAPTVIVLRCPTGDGSPGRAVRLVDRDEWFDWVRAQREPAVHCGGPVLQKTLPREPVPVLPDALLPPSKRRGWGVR
jgi:hypothetical protein